MLNYSFGLRALTAAKTKTHAKIEFHDKLPTELAVFGDGKGERQGQIRK